MPQQLILGFSLYFVILSNLFALPMHNPVPGGLALIEIPQTLFNTHKTIKPPTAFLNKKKLAIILNKNKHYVLAGISLKTKPGTQKIQLRWSDTKNTLDELAFTVKTKTYKAQYLKIKNKRKVNPYKNDMPRINQERKRKNKAKRQWSKTQVHADFITPVDGRISSIFGLRRFFNEQARRPHSGLDIAAAKGTPIKAVADGTVIESGNFFFSGNMLYLDHGQGLISLYAHMNKIEVKTGEHIKRGQIIGRVGETGRVTGPHLHLAIIANQTLIDPLLFLSELKEPE